jgi:hypothetical protein
MLKNGEWTKFVTPVLVTVAIFMLGYITTQIARIDEKLFQHLSNAEIHAPRSQFVSKAEFDLQCKLVERENDRIVRAIEDLRCDIMARFNGKRAR